MNCLQSVTEWASTDSLDITNNLSHLITLLLSGDIELNPGPMIEGGLYSNACALFHNFLLIARKQIKDNLRSHYNKIEKATKCSLDDITSQLYARNIITESVKDSTNYSSIMQQFDSKIDSADNLPKLKLLCEAFLECICQGGPTDDIVETLAREWNEVFDTELLLPGQISVSTRTPSSAGLTGI